MNINSNNKSSGTDFYEKGVRLNYGLDKEILNKYLTFSNFIGQAYYFSEQNSDSSSAIKKKFSDIVGITKINFKKSYNIEYKYKLLENNFTPYEQYLNFNMSNKIFSTNISYMNNKLNLLDRNKKKEKYLSSKFNFKISDKVLISSQYRKNLLAKSYSANAGSISSNNSLIIKGQCIDYIINLNKNYINTNDSKGNYSINFSFALTGLQLSNNF